jgi:hypothetical protein
VEGKMTGIGMSGLEEDTALPPSVRASAAVIAKEREDLLHEMKVTKGCRFNASKRLERRDKRMIVITSFASVYVILLTIFPLFFHVDDFITSVVTAVIILFSLIILASSLLRYSNNDPVRAEQYHRCALEVNALLRALRTTDDCSMRDIAEYSRRYDEIIQKYNLNHDDIDFSKYKLDHSSEYPDAITKLEEKKTVRGQGFADDIVSGMSFLFAVVALLAAALSSDYIMNELHALTNWLHPIGPWHFPNP